jgi:hypothetical protein
MDPRLANNLWQAACLPSWYQFRRASTRVEKVQRGLLMDYLTKNQETEYGRRFKFASITAVEAYQNSVPLTTYDDYTAEIEAISQGEQAVLTTSPVLMLEVSSGSTAASKLIPYTVLLRSEFQRGIASWIYTLFRHNPDLKNGPAYWSITPLTEGRRFTPCGIPIGFEEDTAYLGSVGKHLADSALAVPNEVKHIQDVASFRYVTLLFLLRHQDLRIISVWNPTFLNLLLAPLSEWWEVLLDDIAQGTLTSPNALDPDLRQNLLHQMSPDPQRAEALASIRPSNYQALWPDLGLISYWMDGPAARYIHSLEADFPGVHCQGKGLVATEAFVSFPIPGVTGAVLAVTTHFFEFLPVNSQTYEISPEQPKLAHQLDKGQTYAVVVTTGGGFYRYQLHDIVKVVDYMEQAPCLRFLGKTDQVSDWFGEKLNEHFVAETLDRLFRNYGLSPILAMLAPDDQAEGFRYTLYLELPHDQQSVELLVKLSADLDQQLRRNFHYDYCRKLGQLANPGVFLIAEGGMEAYLEECKSRGQRLGAIKPPTLVKTTGWGNHFIMSRTNSDAERPDSTHICAAPPSRKSHDKDVSI